MPLRILLVCTGNTCRSPMAEAIMRHLLPEDLGRQVRISSAGISAMSGVPASEGARLACLAKGIDISGHLSTSLTRGMIERSDVILTMDRRQEDLVRRMNGGRKVYLITDYPPGTGPGVEIGDPIGLDQQAYGELYDALEGEITRIVGHLARKGRP